MTSIQLALQLIRLRLDSEDFSEIDCPDCQGPMMIHQPDEDLPDRLIGTCESCTVWFLIAASAKLMARLPDEDALRDT
jgi:hypothetical protein